MVVLQRTQSSPWINRLLLLIATLLSILVVQNFQFQTSTSQNLQRVTPIGLDGLPPNYISLKAPEAKPSIRTSPQEEAEISRKRSGGTKYGGVGDKAHLGGFTERDPQGLSENVFNFMLGPLGIKSVIDVGCGKGVSTTEFKNRGAKVLCVEGSHDAVTQSLLPPELIVEHDFSRGPWWPDETFDAVWSVEFLEHVGRHYMQNYIPIFKKAALIFVTSSGWEGWHHVEVHAHWWWQARMEAQGFVYSAALTDKVQSLAKAGKTDAMDSQHIAYGMRVFINPAVAGLKQHHHLISGWGCYNSMGNDNNLGGKECTGEDGLPSDYIPLLDCFVDKAKKEKTSKEIWECKPDQRATIPKSYQA